jgi:hypothetical protein
MRQQCGSLRGTARQCGSAAVWQCAAVQAAMCGSAAVQQYRTAYHQSARRGRGDAMPPVLATPLCIINQQGAARCIINQRGREMLLAVLCHQSARHGRRGSVVIRTSPCILINQRVAHVEESGAGLSRGPNGLILIIIMQIVTLHTVCPPTNLYHQHEAKYIKGSETAGLGCTSKCK